MVAAEPWPLTLTLLLKSTHCFLTPLTNSQQCVILQTNGDLKLLCTTCGKEGNNNSRTATGPARQALWAFKNKTNKRTGQRLLRDWVLQLKVTKWAFLCQTFGPKLLSDCDTDLFCKTFFTIFLQNVWLWGCNDAFFSVFFLNGLLLQLHFNGGNMWLW